VIAICDGSELRDGASGVRFDVTVEGVAATGFVVRYRGQVAGFLNRCAHVAMELDWLPGVLFEDEGRFLMCATHGAIYEPDTGACAGGPCLGRGGLLRLQVIERDGRVWWVPDDYVPDDYVRPPQTPADVS
jgi:nitrite reductase/ring-hydroxylating ferredoxin subunit